MTIHDGSDGPAGDLEPPDDEDTLCSEAEFAEAVRELVAIEAPQMFALVEEKGVRADGRVVAWGITFEGRVEVVSVYSRRHLSLPSLEHVRQMFSRRRKIRLVWTSPTTPRLPEQVTGIAK